jgi:eukaryotic-like serine/threonine-protein kinase
VDGRVIDVGAFQITNPFGRGGSGEVWRGVHKSLGVPVAIKVLTTHWARNDRYLEAFRNELRAVAGLEHPHVVRVFDYGEVSPQAEEQSKGRLVAQSPWLAMEFCRKGSVAKRCGRLRWGDIHRVMVCVMDALAHAHARGVVHRDLKPGNVLLADGPGVKLTDFGLARSLDGDLAAMDEDSVLGTPSYMAPEQIDGSWRDQGPWTDLYGLGCLLYALVTGGPPFGRIDPSTVLDAHLGREPPPLQGRMALPPGLQTWANRLLAKDPAKRYQRAADAAWAFLQIGDPPEGVEVSLESEEELLQEWDAPTTLTWADSDLLPRRRHDGARSWEDRMRGARQVEPVPIPPFPSSWRRPEREVKSDPMLGVGLGVFHLRPVPLVDRGYERDALWSALQRAHQDSELRVVVLQGAAGVGKSRLAEWLSVQAHELGLVHVLKVTHGPTGGPGTGIGGALRRYLHCQGLQGRRVTERIERALAVRAEPDRALVRGLAELVAGEGVGDPRERVGVVSRFLEELAINRTPVFWIDDAHWGEDALAVVNDLARSEEARTRPLLVVLTVREDALAERDAEAAMLRTLMDDPRTAVIDVRPLGPADRPVLFRRLLGLEGPLASRLEQISSGNPMFAVELVRNLVDRGALVPTAQGFALRGDLPLQIPDDLHAVWSARIQRALSGFPEESLQALELAAALGREIDGGEWRAVCALAGVEASSRLVEGLVKACLVVADPAGVDVAWSFRQGMVPESLERGARESGRWMDHHRCCARMLGDRAPNATDPERLGRHLLAAEDYLAALDSLLQGVDARLHTGDRRFAQALLRDWERAMHRLRLPDSDSRWGEGFVRFSRAARLADRSDEAARWAELAAARAHAYGWKGLLPKALRESGEIALQRDALVQAINLLREAGERAQVLGDLIELASCRLALAEALLANGKLERCAAVIAQVQRTSEEQANEHLQCACAILRSRLARQRRQYEDAALDLAEARKSCEALGSRDGLLRVLSEEAALARHRGNHEGSLDKLRAIRQIFGSLGVDALIAYRCGLVRVLLEEGRVREARSPLTGVIRTLRDVGRPGLLAELLVWNLAALAAQGEWSTWDVHFGEANKLLEETGRIDLDVVFAAQTAAKIAEQAGDARRGRRARALAQSQADSLGVGGWAEARTAAPN